MHQKFHAAYNLVHKLCIMLTFGDLIIFKLNIQGTICICIYLRPLLRIIFICGD
jgi:hypothetical protein